MSVSGILVKSTTISCSVSRSELILGFGIQHDTSTWPKNIEEKFMNECCECLMRDVTDQ